MIKMKPYIFKKYFSSMTCWVDFLVRWNDSPKKAVWVYRLEKTAPGRRIMAAGGDAI